MALTPLRTEGLFVKKKAGARFGASKPTTAKERFRAMAIEAKGTGALEEARAKKKAVGRTEQARRQALTVGEKHEEAAATQEMLLEQEVDKLVAAGWNREDARRTVIENEERRRKRHTAKSKKQALGFGAALIGAPLLLGKTGIAAGAKAAKELAVKGAGPAGKLLGGKLSTEELLATAAGLGIEEKERRRLEDIARKEQGIETGLAEAGLTAQQQSLQRRKAGVLARQKQEKAVIPSRFGERGIAGTDIAKQQARQFGAAQRRELAGGEAEEAEVSRLRTAIGQRSGLARRRQKELRTQRGTRIGASILSVA